jgi:Transglycosylase SLT domain
MASSFAEYLSGSDSTAAPSTGNFDKIVGIESGGNQFDKSGKPLTSKAGAVGIAQVMPTTAPEAANLAGIPFDEIKYRTDPEYNKRLGKAYFDKQLEDFGDEAKAAAAYNAGPDAVRKAVQKFGENWLKGIPKETQDYVAKYTGSPTPKTKGSFADALQESSKPKSFEEALNPKQPETNWAGTGPKQSFGEYMKSGFAGRLITGAVRSDDTLMKQADDAVVAQYGKSIKDNPKKYKELWNKEYSTLKTQEAAKIEEEKKANPEPGLGESLKAFGTEVVTHPGRAVAGLIYELGKDPELLGLGVFGAPRAAEATVAAGKAAKALQTSKAIGAAAAKAGGTGVVLETAAEAGDQRGLDLQRIINTGGMFATLGGAMKGAGELYKGVKRAPTPEADIKLNDTLNAMEAETKNKESSDVGTGLTSDVEEAAKTIPPQTVIGERSDTGVPIKHGVILDANGEPAVDSSGKPRMAIMQRDANGNPSHIAINMEEIYRRFEEKPWVTKLGLSEDTFKSADQYAKFILNHEEEHVRQSFDNWKVENNMQDSDIPDNVLRRQYETDVNKRAKASLDEQVNQELDANKNSLEFAGDIFKGTEAKQSPIEAIKITLRDLNINKRAAKLWKQAIEKAVPNKAIRERMTMAIENEKSYDKLLTDAEKAQTLTNLNKGLERLKAKEVFTDEADRAQTAVKIKNLEYVIEKLSQLPSEEHAFKVLEAIQKEFANIGEQAKREGLMDALRQNYVTHVLDFTDSVLNQEQIKTLMDRLFKEPKDSRFVRDFSQHRIYRTIRELEERIRNYGDEMGIDTRGVKVQRDIARIAEIYKQSMMNAVIQRKLVNYLAKTTVDSSNFGQEAIPLITKDPKIAFENGYVQFNGRGSEALKGYAVHPDIVDPLKFAFRQTDPNLLLRALGSISMLSKFLNTMGSLFHATSLFVARSTSRPGDMIKEIFTAGRGTRLALEELEHNGASKAVELALRTGLQTATEDIQKSILSEIGNTTDKLIDNYVLKGKDVKLLRHITEPVEDLFISKMNRFTWDYMHAAGKLHLWQQWFTKIKARNPELSDEQIGREVSSFVNNTLGGLDWLEVADQTQNKYLRAFAMKAFNIQGRDWAQIALFAPDWTLSTLRSFTKALPQELTKPQNWKLREGAKGLFNPKTQSDLARRYVLNTAIAWLTILNGFNMAFTGRPIWTNKDPTRVDLGDGTSMQMAKHSMEAFEWLRDPEKTMGNKLGFWPKALITMTTGKAYPSPNAPMIKNNTALGRLEHSLANALPFQISAAANAPTGEAAKRSFASFMGVPIYGQTDKQHTSPEVKMERKLERKETRRANKEEKLKRKQ